MCPACMQQAVPDLTSPRVYLSVLSPGGAGARLSGLNKLFFEYSILGESVLGHVLPLPLNRSGASGQAQTWPAGPSSSVVQDALEFAKIGYLVLVFWCAKKEPQGRFSIMGHMVAYGSNSPQSSPICRSRTVIKSVLWLVSNGCSVAEIWPFQVLGWCGAPKISLHSVYMQCQQW